MRYRRGLVLGFGLLAGVVGSIDACVGDSTVNPTDGGDATSDGNQVDVVTTPDSGPDAEGGLGPPPTPDGTLIWLNHYNSNAAFNDMVVTENGGLSYVVGGGYATDPSAGNQLHFGNVNLGPAIATDTLMAMLSGTGSATWAKTSATTASGSTGNVDTINSVAIDASNNIYVFGSTQSASITLKDTLTGTQSFVMKLSSTGVPLWEHPYVGSNQLVGGSVAVSGSTLLVTFAYGGTLTYDSGKTAQSPSGSDVFVAALDTSNGTTKWTQQFGSPSDETVTQAIATPQGDFILVGTMNGTMTGLTGPGFPVAQIGDAGTGQDGWVVKIDGSGSSKYALAFGDPSSWVWFGGVDYRNGVVAVSGSFTGSVDFGKGTLTSPNTASDGVVLTIDETTAKTVFSSQVTGASNDFFMSVALDPWGEVVAVGEYGQYNNSAQIGLKVLPTTTMNVSGMVLAKWDPTGKLLWANTYVPTLNGGGAPYTTPDAANGPQSINGARVHTTSTGVVVVTGWMQGGTDFGQGYQAPLSTLQPQFRCGGGPTCVVLNNCKYCPGAPIDGLVGTWKP